MSAAEIVAEVLAEQGWTCEYHELVRECSECDRLRLETGQLVAERLQAADVGACGATGGEVGGNASDGISGAQSGDIGSGMTEAEFRTHLAISYERGYAHGLAEVSAYAQELRTRIAARIQDAGIGGES